MTDEHIQNEGGNATKKTGFWGRKLPHEQTLDSNQDQEDQAPMADGVDDGEEEVVQAEMSSTSVEAEHEETAPQEETVTYEADFEEAAPQEVSVTYDADFEEPPAIDEVLSSETPTLEETSSIERANPYEPISKDVPAAYENASDEAPASDEVISEEPSAPSMGVEPPSLTWDEGETGDNSQFVGGPSSAYSSYIEDSPAYTPMPSAYDMADAAKPKRNENAIRIVAVVVCVVIALVAVYILGVRRFSNRFLPNTRVNGFDVSGQTLDEARANLEKQTADYECSVVVGDFSTSVRGADVGMDRNEEHMASDAMRGQSAYFWPIALLIPNPVEVEANLSFDEDAAKKIVSDAADGYNEKNLPTNNARIALDETSGLYKVTGSTEGTAVDSKAIAQAAADDIRQFKYKSEPSSESVTHQATVEDLPTFMHTAENANRSRTSDISILSGGNEVIISNADQNAQWVTVGAGPKVEVDKDAVGEWAEYAVANAVYRDDDWSYYSLNKDAFVDEFCKRLAEGNTAPFEAPTNDELKTEGESREKAYAHGGWNKDLGRYIDVDLESQFARLFDEKGEVIWESAFVSGSMYDSHSTVTGEFSIYSMQTNTVLVGMDYNGDGYPDYESFVNYWMPFYGGYGLHDATWRSTFGGESYYYNGSHGCVNLPYTKAAELYGITHVGEKVYVHW
ncbi:MAG: L,D-transpeptidase family protein [Atopobiaceae bacterium]|nr:L,D-transpeptidase family protein [Atopobiaceae bacterium]